MLKVIDVVKEYFAERDTIFVFPTEVVATHVAETIALETGKPLPLERFLSWDTFKAKTLSSSFSQEMLPANAIQRRLFISSTFKENALRADRGEKTLFNDLISPDWATNYESFIENTASLLPRLNPLQDSLKKAAINNPYYADLLTLLSDWKAFIKERSIYEPSWERAPFNAGLFRWILICPDLVDDWQDFKTELSNAPEAKIFTIRELIKSEEPPAFLYSSQNQLEEFRKIARLVREDIDKHGIALEDIVISVPKIEESISLLSNEFALFDIPISIHSGRPLAEWPMGDLFVRLDELVKKQWSFPLLRDLLLAPRIPWRKDLPREEFLLFGQKYCCLTGFKEKERTVEVWSETIAKLRPNSRIDFFWEKFKDRVFHITEAKDFAQLQKAMLAFKYRFLDEEALLKNNDNNNVFARIMRELKSLEETVARLSPLEIPSPFGLLLAQLRATSYVPQIEDSGAVHIYSYRVAAGIQPEVHYIVSAGQDALNVDTSPLKLFPEPLRKALQETDKTEELTASELYLLAYRHSGKKTIFSYAVETPSGFVIPHIGLLNPELGVIKTEDPLSEDPWEIEKLSVSGIKGSATRRASLQASSFQSWKKTILEKEFYRDFRKDAVEPKDLATSLKNKLIHQEKGAHLSPTDFNNITYCPFYWLLDSGLKLRKFSSEIETIEQKEIGIVYHKILEELFLQMQEECGRIDSADEERWREVAKEKVSEVLKAQEEREGYFQSSIYAILTSRIRYSLYAFIKIFLENVSPAQLVGVEIPLHWTDGQNEIPLFGKLDLVVKSEESESDKHILLDFKTNTVPQPKELVLKEGEEKLANYQLATYIFLLEENNMPVEKAGFHSMDKRKYVPVVDPSGSKTSSPLPKTRQDYIPETESVKIFFNYSISLLETKLFPVLSRDERSVCETCPQHPFCRIKYLGEDVIEENYG